MERILTLYTYVDGVNDTPFPPSDNQIEIGSFDYNAKRMGGAPTISATVQWESCLDNEWTKNVYASFNGEKYFLKQTPSSSYDNTDLMYEHNIELVSERVALDNVYFYDAVSGTPQEGDKPVSNSANVLFFGTIHEFASRMNASLEYAGLLTWEDGVDEEGNAIKVANGYNVVIDEGVTSEGKQMSFNNQFFSNVLQEIFNTYELPYYFVGKTIHIGYTSNVISEVFGYGVDDALLSISKNNGNTKVVNRVTGLGSEENIPYYYPNDTPKACGVDVTTGDFEVQVVDGEALEVNTKIGDVLTYFGDISDVCDTKVNVSQSGSFINQNTWVIGKAFNFESKKKVSFRQKFIADIKGLFVNGERFDGDLTNANYYIRASCRRKVSNNNVLIVYDETKQVLDGEPIFFDIVDQAEGEGETYNYTITFYFSIYNNSDYQFNYVVYDIIGRQICGWKTEDAEASYSTKKLGLAITGTPSFGDTITVVQRGYINPQKNLMPPIYRESGGDERFYNAINGTYIIPNSEPEEYYEFESPYVDGKPVEQIVEFPDIKPTIKGVLNADGEPIDEFLEFAFDLNDNNEIDADGDYVHSHFFAKLRKLPFNLFDHDIENGEMTINMTGGSLGGCAFTIAVSEEEDENGRKWNTVQVDANGDLVRDDNGNVLCGVQGQGDVSPQEEQNDTRYNEVWIALKKDINYTTYARPTLDASAEDSVVVLDTGGTAIEGKDGYYLPYENTTFVITNILLPKELILDAEERLKTALIDYLAENNQEKFNFSITFSRIYLAEKDEEFLRLLNENARIYVQYNNEDYLLYVSSYSYKMSSGELLPEISVELSEDLTSSQNSLQQAISEVKGDLLNTIGNMDVLGQGTYFFLRKDQKDRARKRIIFEEGLEVGDYNEGTLGSGAKIGVDTNGNTHIEADYLKIRKKATFTQISVQELKSVGGEIVISPAAMVCSSVEETTTTYNDTEVEVYRCYLNTNDNDGNHIYNEFAVDDLARCQTFNVLGTKYYWRTVVGVGDNYIDLSKTECDTNSDAPEAGDNIAMLGNKTDTERQSAILLSAYGENAPSFIMYNGINSFNLANKNITGIAWNPLTQEPRFYSYGDFFFGSRETDEDGNPTGDFIAYQRRAGETERSLNINATVNFSSDSTGLSNLSDWKKMQDQIDGAITSWFYSGVPTLNNAPADEWTTDDMKNNHLGDLYYDEESGKAYRFQLNSSTNVYEWKLISDEDITKALAMAQDAQETADRAQEAIEDIASDSKLTPSEKQQTKILLDSIRGEYSGIVGEAYNYGVSPREYIEAAVAIDNYLSPLLADLTTTSDIVGSDFRAYFTDYYDKAAALRSAISLKAKELADAAQSAINDKQYLFDLLADGSTIIEGGAIMTNLVAVRDANDTQVDAFLNGSDEFSDTTHGKLILAGGIPSSTEMEGELSARASEASTRIYEDGHLVSKSGKLETIEINSLRSMVSQIDNIGYLSNFDEDDSPWYIKEFKKYNGKANSPDDIIFGNNRTSPVKDPTSSWITSWETEPDLTWSISQIGRKRVFINHKNSTGYSVSHLTLEAPSSAFSFFEDGQKKSEITVEANECVELYGYGYHTREDRSQGVFMGWIVTNRVRLYSNYAKKVSGNVSITSGNVSITSGMVYGLRPKTRVFSSSTGTSSAPTYLTEYDHSVLISTTSGTFYLALPDKPLAGQEYYLETFGADIVMKSAKRMWSHLNGEIEYSHTFAARGVIRFKYYAEIGYWTYAWVDAH